MLQSAYDKIHSKICLIIENVYITAGIDRPPVILRHPQDAKIASGSITLAVKACGATPLRYQWYFGQNKIPGMLDHTVSSCLLSTTYRWKEIILYYLFS